MNAIVLASALSLLRAAFLNPPEEAKLQAWWHWMDDEYTPSTLVKDLDAMHGLGVSTAYVFAPGAWFPIDRLWAPMLSEKWLGRFDLALAEAKKRGMKLGFHNCPGWSSSGGPWIDPAHSMKVLVASVGATPDLPRPDGVRCGFYRDVATLAFEVSGSPAMVDDLENLGRRTSAYGYGMGYRPPRPGTAEERGIDPARVFEVGSGELPPPKEGCSWCYLRIGFTTTGMKNKPSTLSGLECDKLDRSGIEAHWPHMPALLGSRPGAAETLKYCVIDSYEAGGQNWTERMPEQFRRLRGYDLRRRLPALFGYVVGTRGETAKFLHDYQRTVSDLFRREYYGRFVELCREAGYVPVIEGYDGPYDPLEVSMLADVPCGEFWVNGTGASNADPGKTPTWAASAAHLNGRRFVAAESFTTGDREGRWQTTPAQLRREGDRAWLHGVNQLVYHSYVAQPFENVKPGLSLAKHGSHLNRNTTWIGEGRGWSDYVARGQTLLQAGESHVEWLVLSGDGNPYSCMEPLTDVLDAGMNYDWIPASKLKYLVAADDGRAGMKGLPPYEALSLGEDRYLKVATLREIKRLKDAGVRICGRRPLDTPALTDDRRTWTELVDEIFKDLPETRAELAIAPFATWTAASARKNPVRIRTRRRDVGEAVVYYLLNDGDEDFRGAVSFATRGGAECWRAEDGTIGPLDPRDVGIPAHKSIFVVVDPNALPYTRRPPAATRAREPGFSDLSTDWTVTFDGPGAPKGPVHFPKLVSWSEHPDPRIRCFSGRARYEKRVEGLKGCRCEKLILDLGDVRDVVNVFIDGRKVATLWEPPYRLDLSTLQHFNAATLQPFNLVLEVVNCWPNRMIGDAVARRDNPSAETPAPVETWFPAAAAKIFSKPLAFSFPTWVVADRPDSGTGIYTWSNHMSAWSADDALLPAGLLGPVRICFGRPRASGLLRVAEDK